MSNPIQYTNRTYNTILNDINNDPELVDKPDWFKRLIAGIGDVISMWNNAAANNLQLPSAFTRESTQKLLELIDYSLTPQSTSSGTILFYLKDTVTFPFTVAKADLAALTSGSALISALRYEARSSASVTEVTDTFTNTEVNTTTDVITVTRDFMTGEKVRLTTTGTLPTPLALATDYYVIRVSATEIKLAETLANAYAGTAIDLTAAGSGTNTITLYSFQVTCYQQTAKDQFTIGTSDGSTLFQRFRLSDTNILEDTLEIEINSLAWTKVDSLVDSKSTDRHYRVYYQADNSLVVQFGDGTYGMIPPAFDVLATYAFGGGSNTNVSSSNGISVYGGGDANINGVSNPSAFTGGGDAQTIENAKVLGPLLLKARDRFVTVSDGEALAVAFGGVSQTNILPNEYGVLSCKVVNIADGGGNLSAPTKTALQTYLIERTVLESIDVRVEDATITSTAVTSAAKVLTGFTWSGQVEDRFRLGWKLFFSEAGQEIIDDYDSNGVDSARTLINSIFSESFTEDENSQITQFLDNLVPRRFGVDINQSDAFGFIDSHTIGVDYITITAPTFPIALDEDEITTYGTLTLTEIP